MAKKPTETTNPAAIAPEGVQATAPEDSAALAAEKKALEAERKALEDEKAALAAEKNAMAEAMAELEAEAGREMSAAELQAEADALARKAKEARAQETAAQRGAASVANAVPVYCKLPAGLEFPIPGNRGTVKLAGSAAKDAVAGYGITHVNADVWAAIKKAYGNMAFFKNGVVFDAASRKTGDSQAGEQTDIPTGLEGVDPKNPAAGLKQDDGK